MDTTKLENLGKTMELAGIIMAIKPWLSQVDLEFAKSCQNDLRDHASFLRSAAVLNPLYNPAKTDILIKQAESIGHLVSFIECLKEVTEMKDSLQAQNAQMEDIMKLFQ